MKRGFSDERIVSMIEERENGVSTSDRHPNVCRSKTILWEDRTDWGLLVRVRSNRKTEDVFSRTKPKGGFGPAHGRIRPF